MLTHYLRIAFRNMAKQKMYTAIKVGGFAIGIAACILIALLIRDEMSYDTQYKNAANIYRLVGGYINNGKEEKGVSLPAPMATAMKANFPEVEKAGRLMPSNLFYGAGSNQLRRDDEQQNTYEEGFVYADQELIDILQLPMVYGDRAKALAEPNTIVITRRKAEKYFPGQDPVGRLLFLNNDTKTPYKIGGVMEDWPSTSHLQYDFLLTLTGKSLWDGEQTWWLANNYGVYLQLKPGTDIKQFEKKSSATIIGKYYLPAFKAVGQANAAEEANKSRLYVQPLKDIHLKSYEMGDWETRGDIRFVWLFAAIACFILVIACINFLNLSTARSANRAKEVGLRKVIGSQRSNLIKQFLTESILYSFFAFILGLLLAWASLPYFNKIAGKSLSMPIGEWWMLPLIIAGALFIGLLAGLYPSFYLSAFKPIQVLKGQLSRGSKNAGLRSTLVVFQFTTSIILLIGTVVIYRQMQYILHAKTGFDKDQVVMIQGTGTLGRQTATLKNELLKLPQVQQVSVSGYLPVAGTKRDGNPFWKEGRAGQEAFVSGQKWYVDDSYISTFGMKLVAGRNFSPVMPTDTQAAIINQAMADKIGYKDPIGKKITNGWQTFTVIGMVENFNYESMKQRVEPICLALGHSNDIVSVKIKSGEVKQTLAAITGVWKGFAPNQAIRYTFLDERFAAMYADVERTGIIFTCFAALAIIVACLGLFALAAFMAEQRSKEISIRKVLGASIPGLFLLLTNNFLRLILISLLIAAPAGWYLMQKWLQDYEYRIAITWDIFAISGIVVFLIALTTICYQAVKAALANPVESLRAA
ncbi:FtsX-like permease family protein [Pseudoflavitalea sp. X16]|uniref:ABC transporter permease n=1 Tax=Paraflavitalea devenefica TaxID=2716334 RepID=UPI00142272A2|nr:ABC transporter permease [Paraflavitalea devenefica]NII26790.1 FtsX-like permease family protein [Paraflavitalea devenefica]